jgi:hypothetical protein
VADVVRGIDALDAASSLGDVLERLAQAAAAHAERTAIFVVRNGVLREWRRVGFASSAGPRSEVRLDAAGFLAEAVEHGKPARAAGRPLPPFAGEDDREAVAIPVMVGGQVVAVLYCDCAPRAGDANAWTVVVELLARYASRVLETMTVQQATGLRPLPGVAQPSQP